MPTPALPWIADDEPLPPTASALGPGADAPGLLAIGPPVTPQRLEEAYRRGVFPWYSPGQPPLWWSPDPRMVLPLAEFKLSRSLRKTLRRFIADPRCEIRIDTSFSSVMQACAQAPRQGQAGTWIVPELIAGYTAWHDQGRAHSVETWVDGELVGGLYGVGGGEFGRMFFGESMFARQADASKIALAGLVAFCLAHGITLIDCQQHSDHLASFGAREITRGEFEAHLNAVLGLTPPQDWNYHSSHWAQLGIGGTDGGTGGGTGAPED